MRSDGWSRAELAILEAHMHERDWIVVVSRLIPRRTENAIKGRMAKLRAEAGVADRSMAYFHDDARRGSLMLLRALQRIAA